MQLVVDGIGLSYDGRSVLQDVSFTLNAGERALLLGPSGSGKSSLLNIICGLQKPNAGQVSLGDDTVSNSNAVSSGDRVRRRHMGVVFQTLRLVSALNLKANLLLAQKLQTGGHDKALVDQTLERLDIAHRAQARPFELSQGEAQRAAIARALVVKPSLLIADEPTSALDAQNTEKVARLLMDLASQAGASLLVATHDDRLKPYFEQSMALENGRLAI
ncbi:MAG: ATP-binding cassette domain-containing protein [Pseudomonadota bacterium]